MTKKSKFKPQEKIDTGKLAETQTAAITGLAQTFASHPSNGLTPARLRSILEDAERGNLAAQAELGTDMMEKNAHLYSEMSKRARALLTLDWTIAPPPNASAAEKRTAEQMKEWFNAIPDKEDVFLDMLDAMGHGFAALEMTWGKIEKYLIPSKLVLQPQSCFQTPPTNGNLIRLRDNTPDGADLWQYGWVLHTHRAKPGYITRGGLFRVLAWPYLFSNYSIRDLAELLEIYGIPMRVGKYPIGSSKADQEMLLRAVREIGHSAAGIMPEAMKIEFIKAGESASGSANPFMVMVSWAEKSISKAVLGGTLTSQADGATSTNALGNVHNEVRHDLIVSDARQLASTINRDLIAAMVAINIGQVETSRLPIFSFDTRQFESLELYSNALPKLVASGMPIPVSWVQEKLNIPAPKDGEPILQMQSAPSAAVKAEARAVLTYRAMLTNASGELVTVDQHAIDEMLARLPGEQVSAAMAKMLAPAVKAALEGDTPDAIAEALLTAHPEMDSATLVELLERAIFVADIWGQLNA